MTITAIVLLATFVEGTVEYVLGKVKGVESYLPYISLAAGIAAAFAYHVNVFATLGVPLAGIYPWVDYVVSGLVIGRGANYLNTLTSLGAAAIKKNTALASHESAVAAAIRQDTNFKAKAVVAARRPVRSRN